LGQEVWLRILIVTDAWEPQVNGVVRTLKTTARELHAMGHEVRFLTPLEFRTLPCPTYPEIRLSLFPQRRVNRTLREFDPDVLHLATEGPLGLAARRWALRHDFPFTTAYHTRFPEYVHARLRLPLAWSYAWLRRFHGPSRAVMAPTQVVVDDLLANGFTNVRLWSRGVDGDVFHPQPSRRLDSAPPIFLYVGRVAVEKNVAAFLELELPGSKWVVGTGPALEGIRTRFPHVNYLGLLEREELARVYAAAECLRVPQQDGYLRTGLAGGHGLRVAGGGLSSHRPARCHRRFQSRGLAHGPAHRLPRGAAIAPRGRSGARPAVLMARGHRAVLRQPASAPARVGRAGVRLTRHFPPPEQVIAQTACRP
jgi:glycosyltransferase involved in cell wall biosynthesis